MSPSDKFALAQREAVAKLLAAYDQSGLTGLGWFAPYMEAVRLAFDESMTVDELRAAISDEALSRAAAALVTPSTWHNMNDVQRLGLESHAWACLRAALCDGVAFDEDGAR